MSCSICQHPKRQAIDQALTTGAATLAALSQEYGLSTSALQRHKAHLTAKLNRAQTHLQENLRQGCLFWLSQALHMAMQTAQVALGEGHFKVVLQAISQGTRIINIILKQDFPLDSSVVYQILTSPQWTAQDSLLPQDPQVLAASRQSLAEELFTPCAEPGEVSPDSLNLAALQEALDTLSQPSVIEPKKENRKLNTGNRFKKRQKGGKLAGKASFATKNNKEYQEDGLNKINSGKDHQTCRPGALLEDLAAGRVDFDQLNAIGAGRTLELLDIFKDMVSSEHLQFAD